MDKLFNVVLTTSIYASVVGLTLIFIKGLLKSRLNAKWQYIVWIVLMLKLIMPFGPEASFSLFNAVPDVSYSYSPANTIQQENQAQFLSSDLQSPSPDSDSLKHSDNANPLRPKELAPYVWAAGVAIMLLWLCSSYLLLYLKLRNCSNTEDLRILEIYESSRQRMNISRKIPVLVQDIVGMPSLFGLFCPKILLPSNAIELSCKEIEYILLHELAHYKRRDYLINHLMLLLQAVHWFNPIMWYCFSKIRQDMEVATDEAVLSILAKTEHKDYGIALIAMLERFSAPSLAPKLLAMADDKKSIERRIKMIKMADFFKGKRRLAVILGLTSVLLLSGILLTNGITTPTATLINKGIYDAEKLMKNKTLYVGNNVKVGGIISSLPSGGKVKQFYLQTAKKPYGIKVDYEFTVPALQNRFLNINNELLVNNAAVIFSLVDNVDSVEFAVPKANKVVVCTRDAVQRTYPEDLRNYSSSKERFEQLLNSFEFKIEASPSAYSPAMSSTPGLRLKAVYLGGHAVKTVRFHADKGRLFTWSNGKISEGKDTLDTTLDREIYWSPLTGGSNQPKDTIASTVIATFLDDKGKKLWEMPITIINEKTMLYKVKPDLGIVTTSRAVTEPKGPSTVDEGVSLAIKAQGKSYRVGETITEGHIILKAQEMGPVIKVYTVASVGQFGFEDGVFTKISGSGAIPTIITLSNDPKNKYALLEYKEPQDGEGYAASIKEIFPRELQAKALNAGQYGIELVKQEEAQAAEYLKGIGIKAKVSAQYLGKKPVNINVEASNKLFAGAAKYDAFINACPYWIGTVEQLEGGQRYIYETAQDKTSDGYDLIIFRKIKADGTLVKEAKYKIVGSEPQLMQ